MILDVVSVDLFVPLLQGAQGITTIAVKRHCLQLYVSCIQEAFSMY